MELRAAVEAIDAWTRFLERDYPRTCHLIDSLYEDLTTTRVEVREYQERHSTLEERVIAAKRQIAKLQGASTSSHGP